MRLIQDFSRVTSLAFAASVFLITTTQAQVTTITGTAGSRDSWNTSANWSGSLIPSGTAEAVVGSGVLAQVESASNLSYSGGLTLNTNARLQVGWTNAVHDGTNIIITPTDDFYGVSPGIDKLFARLNVVIAP